MTEQEEREEFLSELRNSLTKLCKRAACSLKAAWCTSDELGRERQAALDKLERIGRLALRGDVEPEWALDQISNIFGGG